MAFCIIYIDPIPELRWVGRFGMILYTMVLFSLVMKWPFCIISIDSIPELHCVDDFVYNGVISFGHEMAYLYNFYRFNTCIALRR